MRHSINVSPFKDRRRVKRLAVVLILALNFSGNVYNNNNLITGIQTQTVRTA